MDGRKPAIRMQPPRMGAHTRAVLEESGFSAEEIERLVRDGVVTQEDGLAHATNRHNLQLQLSDVGSGSALEADPRPLEERRTGPLRPPAEMGGSILDLIER